MKSNNKKATNTIVLGLLFFLMAVLYFGAGYIRRESLEDPKSSETSNQIGILNTNALDGTPEVLSVSNGITDSNSALSTSGSTNSNAQTITNTLDAELLNTPNLPSLELVKIFPGTFIMGSPKEEVGHNDHESPQTSVSLTYAYWIGKYPITVEQYEEIITTASHDFKVRLPTFNEKADNPVKQMRYQEADFFCRKLTELSRNTKTLPPGYIYRLPTEAEREYACRAGTTNRFSFGDDPTGTELGSYAWYVTNSEGTTHRVGSKKPNAWGLYDMLGQVEEWCQDWIPKYPGGNVTNLVGIVDGRLHVCRGGSWDKPGEYCRCATRRQTFPLHDAIEVGFRVVVGPELNTISSEQVSK